LMDSWPCVFKGSGDMDYATAVMFAPADSIDETLT
jgi:hypothetical protein